MGSVGQVMFVLIAGHFLNTFLLWGTHYLLHQKIFGIPFYRIHLGAHHRIDYVDEYVLNVSSLFEHMVWVGLGLAAIAIYFLLLPQWIAILLSAELLSLAVSVYFIHKFYEGPGTWLERFKWYRDGKALHRLHHSYRPQTDPTADQSQHMGFRRSVNYSFGGMLTGALMDRLFHTYMDSKPGSA